MQFQSRKYPRFSLQKLIYTDTLKQLYIYIISFSNGRLDTSHEMEGIQKFVCKVAIHNWNATMKIYYRNGVTTMERR